MTKVYSTTFDMGSYNEYLINQINTTFFYEYFRTWYLFYIKNVKNGIRKNQFSMNKMLNEYQEQVFHSTFPLEYYKVHTSLIYIPMRIECVDINLLYIDCT